MRLVFNDNVLLNTCGSAVIDLGDTAAAVSAAAADSAAAAVSAAAAAAAVSAAAAAAAAAFDNHELTTITKATSIYCTLSASSKFLSFLTRLKKKRKMQVP